VSAVSIYVDLAAKIAQTCAHVCIKLLNINQFIGSINLSKNVKLIQSLYANYSDYSVFCVRLRKITKSLFIRRT